MAGAGRGRRAPLAVAVRDGGGWKLAVLRRAGGRWQVHAQAEHEAGNERQVPRVLLEAAVAAGARRLRLLLDGDPRLVSIEAHHELSPAELQAALLYEARGELGADAGGMRFAAAAIGQYELGAGDHDLLTAWFETERLCRFAEDARRAGLRFEAAGSLAAAVFHRHAARCPQRRLLLVREQTSFYVVPAGEAQPFLAVTLPLGLEALNDAVAGERAERARERLAAHRALPLSVIIAGAGTADRRAELAPLLGGAADVEMAALAEVMPEIVALAAGGHAGGPASPCGLIGLPPPARDPHRHGTVLMCLVLLLTLGWVALQRQSFLEELEDARARLAAWEALETERTAAVDEAERLRLRLDEARARRRFFSEHQPLPGGVLALLDAAAGHMPEYSRLESVRQVEGGLEITGVTRWQEGLSHLEEGLRQAAMMENMRRESGGIEMIEETGLQRFRFILRAGEARP